MRTPALPSPRRIAAGAGLALLAAGLTPIAASATPAGDNLVISEVYGAGGSTGATYTHDFIEIFNPTAAPISLNGKSLQYRSTASTTASANVFALPDVAVPAGGHFLVSGGSGANGAALPVTADAASALNLSGTNGQIFLATGTTGLDADGAGNVAVTDTAVIDFVGFGTATIKEGAAAAPAPSITTSITRNAAGADTDENGADFVATASMSPQNLASGTATGPTVETVAGKAFTVNEAITPFTVTATGGTAPYAWSATGLPAGLSINETTGEVTGTPTAAGVSSVTVTATDADDAADSETFSVTVNPAGVIAIDEVQGSGATSPLLGTTVTTRGIVTAAYPVGGFFGFYIQTPGTGAAGIDLATHTASDAVFVRQTTGTVTAAPGTYVEVTGKVTEFAGATQVEVVPADIEVLPDTVDPIVTTTTATWPRAAAEKESLEGMRYRPTGDFTVSNTFSTNNFGEVGLAQGDTPLIQRTEVELPGPAGSSAVEADNLARAVVLDDGASTNFLATSTSGAVCGTRPTPCLSNGDLTPPYISTTDPVRVGAAATFTEDVIFTQGGSPSAPTYRFQPLATVVGPDNAGSPATFEDTRTAAPDEALINEVGEADIKVASFNVLNYFTTLGDPDNDNAGNGGCTPFRDRDGDGNTVNSGCDQRGAWDPQDFERQQSKIVDAINALDADVVGLMEIENSLSLGETADEATNSLVTALNADAGAGTWAANPSSAELPAGGMDVITNAIIYKPASVDRVGASRALGTLSDAGEAFDNAREPLGQVFEADAGGEPFLFVVNHFKSKGSAGPWPGDADTGDGQGSSNESRVRQATALRDWVGALQTETGVDSVVLGGDFNSYAMEDPLQVLYTAGFTNVEQHFDNGEFSYSFSGLSGSLDHILVNDAALDRSTGTDIWNINGGESLALEYSRWNYHGTDFHAEGPFRSSDHDPVLLGLTADDPAPTTTDVQIIGSNDYHGRLAAGPRLAAYVKAARQANPNTVFAAAGDLVGATTFESFIQHDKPTIDVMNEAGLDVSAVGNHEFDAGYDDLVNRIMAPYDATTNPEGGAEWQYLGANVKFKADGSDALEGTWIQDFGAVEVGFVGAVTEDLPSLVAADGIADIEVTDIVDATNEAATELKAEGADVVVLLVHEGAGGTSYASATTPGTVFGDIVNGVSADVDAIVSGHTHLAYNHSVPVPAWVAEERAVTERPVVSAGQYGENLNKLVFTVDNATGDVQAKTQEIVPFASFPATGDAATQTIVNDANAKAAVLGAQPLGKIEAGFSRAKFVGGAENRGGESTLNNLVAEVQRWSTDTEIAFMNPGGLRADMPGTGTDYPRTVTYKNAADVQPFANTLVKMGLKGSSIKKLLEQQWQRLPNGNVPSRPFLKLGVSNGFEYTYDPTRAEGDRITGMWLDGEAIDADTTYQVGANAFLASGTGDNFYAFSEAIDKRDSGKVDLAAMVDYMAAFATDADPLDVDYSQRAVGVTGVTGDYAVGQTVTINLTSLAMTGVGDVQDATVDVEFDGQPIGDFPVDNTANAAGDANSNDEAGRATVSFRVPAVDAGGTYDVVITGASTGTSTTVPVTVQAPTKVESTVTAAATPSSIPAQTGTSTIDVEVTAAGGTPTGTVAAILDGKIVGGGELVDGKADVVVGPFATAGTKAITIRYYGDAATLPAETSVSVTVTPAPVVEKATPTITATATPAVVKVKKDSSTVSVTVTRPGGTATGTVLAVVDNVVVGAGDLVGGSTSITVGPFETIGDKAVTLRYLGDDATKAGNGSVTIAVQKATPRVNVRAPKAVAQGSKAKVVVDVAAAGFDPSGTVTVKVDGKKVTRTLTDGKVIVKVRLSELGKQKVTVTYSGDDLTESGRDTTTIKVKRR
jgi:5'-nucleotidase